VKACGGAGHTLAITSDGHLYSWGKNYLGQLGLGDDDDRYFPQLVTLGEGVRAHACAGGGNFSAIVDTEGNLWTTGCGFFHANGLDREINVKIPTRVYSDDLSGRRLVNVACGDLHALAVTDEGLCLSWGSNKQGQCGQGSDAKHVAKPTVIRAFSDRGLQVMSIACGTEWSIAACSNGTVWVWGDNSLGQLGLSQGQYQSHEIQTEKEKEIQKEKEEEKEPKEKRVLGEETSTTTAITFSSPQELVPLRGEGVISVSAGHEHGLALTVDGCVWAWGQGKHGKLGLGPCSSTSSTSSDKDTGEITEDVCSLGYYPPQRIPYIEQNRRKTQQKIVGIAAAKEHSLFLREDGRVMVTGDDQFGNVAVNVPVNPRPLPYLVDGLLSDVNAAVVAVGGYHSIVLSRQWYQQLQ
jgi:alpha-tubulin suppressor-like RCC1 family protein